MGDIEQAYLNAAQTKAVPEDALMTDVLVSHVPAAASAGHSELVDERGIPVLQTGKPLDSSIVNETLDAIQRERDLSILG